jgi:hypothetical protein
VDFSGFQPFMGAGGPQFPALDTACALLDQLGLDAHRGELCLELLPAPGLELEGGAGGL